jgi:hypothetical protein
MDWNGKREKLLYTQKNYDNPRKVENFDKDNFN